MKKTWLLGLVPLAFQSWAGDASAQDVAPPPPMASPSGQPGPNGQPADQNGKPADQNQKLQKDEKKDSGRGLEFFYLNADAGFSYIDMAGISTSNLGLSQTSSAGGVFGVGAGIRLFILTLGARANLNEASSFNLWQLDAELAFHIPLGHFDPYIGFHGGYDFVGTLDSSAISSAASGSPNVAVHGGDGGINLGLDYYFNHFISLGGDVAGSILFLQRPVPTNAVIEQLPPADQKAYQATGSSIGLGVAPTIHLGLHL